jgi:hypothetical protein
MHSKIQILSFSSLVTVALLITGCGSGAYQKDENPSTGTPPEINILGANPSNVYVCDTYIDQNATAIDKEDGNLTSQIIITGLPMDTSKEGAQTVTYSVTDSDGNTVVETRTVNVVFPESNVTKKTGQTNSYDENGAEYHRDCILKDDGFYQMGLKSNYTRDPATETVTDHVTGLVWEDGVHVRDGQQNYTDAKNYCTSLGTDWRLPEVWELLSIVDKSRYKPAIDPVFQYVFPSTSLGYTWSNTVVYTDTKNAWVISFDFGLDVSDVLQSRTYYGVRCVKGTPLPTPGKNYQKDSLTKIISNGNGLEWVDNDTLGIITKTWEQAIDTCENLTIGGHSDWRLPNINEYYSIYDYERNEIDPTVFNLVQGSVKMWSSTSPAATYLDRAWVMKQTNGDSSPVLKTDLLNFMCVRNQ